MSKQFKLERKPIPDASKGTRKYPFHEMKVGDSFFVEGNVNIIGCAKSFALRNPGTKFIARTEGTGKRCWRIA